MRISFKKYIILICVAALSMSAVAQIKVINNKGTFFQIDTSKWELVGVDIYNKNQIGNVGVGTFPYNARFVVDNGNSSILPAFKLKYPFSGAITDHILTWDSGDSTVRKLTLLELLTGNAIISLNGLTASTQTFTTGTSGTDFNIVSSGSTHTFNLPNASSTSRGLLTSADWITFNNKIDLVTATTAAAVTTTGTTATILNNIAYWNANQLQGRNISTSAPTNGQFLRWNGSAWTPTTTTVSNTVTAPNSIRTTVNGVVGANVSMVTGVSNTSSNNSLSTTVNGVIGSNVNIINSIVNSIASGQLTTTVNGVSATAVTLPTPDGSETKINNGTNTTVTGAGTIASPYTINVADATTTAKGVIQLAGDLTGTATSPQIAASAVGTNELANSSVTYAKMQNVTGQRLLGNPTTTAAAPSEISLGSGLTFSGTTLNTVNNGTVTTVTGTSPIVITGTPTSTPNVTITRNNIVAGASSNTATNPLVLDAGASQAVVGGVNATLTVNNTAPLWNANQIQGKDISTTAPSDGQLLTWNTTSSLWEPSTYITNAWNLTGNASTNPATNFLGTTDAQKLVFRTNNIERMTILSGGYVGIGETNPSNLFHINGTNPLRIEGLQTNTTDTNLLVTTSTGVIQQRGILNLLSGKAILSLNGLTGSIQTFATGTTGTDFNIVSSGSAHTFNFPNASSANRGLLTNTDWITFNNKIATVTATTAAAVTTVGTTATINNTGAYWNANQLQSRNVASTAPTDGQVLSWNNTSSQWEPSGNTYQSVVVEIYDAAGTQALTSSFANITFGSTNIVDAGYTVGGSGSQITVTTAGTYRITYRISARCTTNQGNAAEFQLTRNGTFIAGTRGYSKHHNSDRPHGTVTVVKIITLSANDIIRVQGRQYSSNGSISLSQDGSSLIIERIK